MKPSTPPLPPDLKDRVLNTVESTSAPTREKIKKVHLIAAGLAAIGVLITFFVWGGGPHYGFREWGAPREPAMIALTFLGAAAIAAACLYFATRWRRSMLSPPARALALAAIATTCALFAWKWGITALFPGALEMGLDRAGFKCLRMGTVMGLFPLAALLFMRRDSEFNHPVLTGVLFGAASGAVSWVFVDLWCPAAFARHLMIGHVLPMVNLAVIGALVGWWILLPRTKYKPSSSPK